MRTILRTAFGIIIGYAGLILISRLFGPLPFNISQITTQKQSTFDVTGTGKVTVAPDKAVVNLGVTASEPTVAQAQERINTIINAVTNELDRLDIDSDDIKTENYSIYPDYGFGGIEPAGQNRIQGYTANTTISVSITDFEKLNQAIDTATAVGANQVGGINFTLTDGKKEEVEAEARLEAIEDAKETAEELARLSGMRLGKIVNVWETPQAYPYYARDLMMESAAPGMGSGAPTELEPGTTTYEFSVTLSYETL